MTRVLVPVALALGLACGFGDLGGTSETVGGPVAVVEDAAPDHGVYTNDVRGVCRKYTHCRCNTFGTIDACVAEFGRSVDFPPEVWSCVLARDCEGLCEFNAGTCFELYALRTVQEPAPDKPPCPEGQHRLETYDAGGKLVASTCR